MSRKSVYISMDESTREVEKLQIDIMLLVTVWVKTEKTPVPRREIVEKMKKKGKTEEQIDHAIRMLIGLGFIRRGESHSNKTVYIQLRTVHVPEEEEVIENVKVR